MAIHYFDFKNPFLGRMAGYFNNIKKAKPREWQKILNTFTKEYLTKSVLIKVCTIIFFLFISTYACWFILAFFIWVVSELITSVFIWLEDEKMIEQKALSIEILEPALINAIKEKETAKENK